MALLSPYRPRSYQYEFLNAMQAGTKRAALVWHRRAGKDLTVLNWVAYAMTQRPGVYYYFLPTYAQAKKIIWDGIDGSGRPFMANFPEQYIASKHETELKLTFYPTSTGGAGSVFQLIGGDNIDTIVGTNPVGVVFSEYALMNPRAWDLTQPILMENGGWAVFVYTPRGKNHGYKLWVGAKEDPTWFTSLKTVDDTRRDSDGEGGEPVVTTAQIEEVRRTGMTEELLAQEFYVSFEGAMQGAYYADQLAAAQREGRITSVPYDPMLPVDTAWDLGLDDAMAIWFTQTEGGLCRVIDYLEAHTHGLDWYAAELRRRPYQYGEHFAPYDIAVRELSSGNSRLQLAAKMGIHFQPQPKLAVEDGIAAGRRLLPITVFDALKCEKGLDALKSYRREYDEKLATWRQTPVHDWASHAADAWRTRAVAWRGGLETGFGRNPYADTTFNVWGGPGQQREADMSERHSRLYSRDHAVTVEHPDDWAGGDSVRWGSERHGFWRER